MRSFYYLPSSAVHTPKAQLLRASSMGAVAPEDICVLRGRVRFEQPAEAFVWRRDQQQWMETKRRSSQMGSESM